MVELFQSYKVSRLAQKSKQLFKLWPGNEDLPRFILFYGVYVVKSEFSFKPSVEVKIGIYSQIYDTFENYVIIVAFTSTPCLSYH